MTLTEVIIRHIQQNGPVSFRDFMEMALYYPGNGYYTSGINHIGRDGDYLTSPQLSPVFAAIIAKQLEEMWSMMGCRNFTIVEYGAGSGMLSAEILRCIQQHPIFFNKVSYHVIEKNIHAIIEYPIAGTNKIKVHSGIDEMESFEGCIFSNELIDNFPVHRVVMQKQLMEVYVDYKNGFVEFLVPANDALVNYMKEFEIILPEGYYTEINLDAGQWIKDISQKLTRGYLITIDYGFDANGLYNKRHRNGTLVCFHRHAINDQPYAFIGEQDITAHVNFSALKKWGSDNMLEFCGLTSQADFLLALGFKEYFINEFRNQATIQQAAEHQMLMNRLLLIDMGEKFKVLIQKKGLVSAHLTGLKNYLPAA